MAWDGNGTFSRTNGGGQTGASTWQNAQAAGHNIVSNQHDTHDQDIATGLNAALTKNNETKPTADFRPNADAAIDLGSAALQWRDLFLSRDLVFGGNMDAKKGADIASAATTDLGATRGLMHDITGTTPITSFGTGAEGMFKIIKFEGALTLTHNATSLILPGAANITTADGDVAIMVSEGSGNWRCASYQPATVSKSASVYQYTAWDPSDVAGTATNAPATAAASITAPAYLTMANSSGTLTLTCVKAGNYIVTVSAQNEGLAGITDLWVRITKGGTGTLIPSTVEYPIHVFSANGAQGFSGSVQFTATLTAGQTVTILPALGVLGAGVVGNYTQQCTVTAAYVGSA